MNIVASTKVIQTLFPECTGSELAESLKLLEALDKEANKNMAGKNKDYRQGFSIGKLFSLKSKGEEKYGPKDIDQLGDELLDENDYGDLPVEDEDAFKEGMWIGYLFTEEEQEEE